MAFIFTMRSTPVGSSHRRDPNSQSILPPIEEDGAAFTAPRVPPPVPPRAWNRPAHKVFGLGAPPRRNFDSSPPAYSQFDSTGVEGPNGEKLSDVRKGIKNNKHIAKRGGWKKLALIALVVILSIVGLVVGLVVGLRKKHHSNNSNSGIPEGGASGSVEGGDNNPASNTTFPAGSYTFETQIASVSTNCTSNSLTWNCNSGSPTADFMWIITPSGETSYNISSTGNAFSIMFANETLTLNDAGTDNEHYSFKYSTQDVVVPREALTPDNVAARCYFNQTMFQASLYTKMEKTYPANATATNTTEAFTPWPYAVQVEEIANAGAGTPSCLDASGDAVGGDYSVADTAQTCECLYVNTGT